MYTVARKEKKFVPSAKVIGSLQCFILCNARVWSWITVESAAGWVRYCDIDPVSTLYLAGDTKSTD